VTLGASSGRACAAATGLIVHSFKLPDAILHGSDAVRRYAARLLELGVAQKLPILIGIARFLRRARRAG